MNPLKLNVLIFLTCATVIVADEQIPMIQWEVMACPRGLTLYELMEKDKGYLSSCDSLETSCAIKRISNYLIHIKIHTITCKYYLRRGQSRLDSQGYATL